MNILLVEPYYGGSHKRWCDELKLHSSFKIHLLTLPAHYWKWRMHGAAITLANKANLLEKFSLIVVSDMIDLALFKSMYRNKSTPIVLYMHENQITYPFNCQSKERNNEYGWINFTSCLVADAIAFNSDYHRIVFIDSLPEFLKQFPQDLPKNVVEIISEKSETLSLGMDLSACKQKIAVNDIPVVLWNHRWEHDKNPEEFFDHLKELKLKSIPFKLIVLGQSFKNSPKCFEWAKAYFEEEILHWGFTKNIEEYYLLIAKANVIYVTSNQDFFGGSVVEAIASGVVPLVPNRLAYKDYVAEDNIYAENEGLNFLIKLLDSFQDCKYDFTSINRYNWKQCVSEYDAYFQKTIGTKMA